MVLSGSESPIRANTKFVKDVKREDCRRCHKSFHAFRRRHHCRFCGDIFCDDCAPVRVEKAHSATRGPGVAVRLCVDCDATPRVLLPHRRSDGTVSITMAQRIISFLDAPTLSEVMSAFPDVRRTVSVPGIPLVQSVRSVFPDIVTGADVPMEGFIRSDRDLPSAADAAEASGAQGCVYFTSDPQSGGAQVAVKIVSKVDPSMQGGNASDKARHYRGILNEIRVHESLTARRTSNVAPLLRCFQTPTHIALVILAAEGGSVKKIADNLRACSDATRDEFVALALVVLYDAARALSAIHGEYVHRDIKWENLVMTNDYNSARVIDFGLATRLAEDPAERVPFPCTGSPYFFPPELLEERRRTPWGATVRLTPREARGGDVFCLAMVAYRILVGKPLYPSCATSGSMIGASQSLIALWSFSWRNVYCGTPEFCQLLSSMFELDPAARPTIEEVLAHPAFEDIVGVRRYLSTRRLMRRQGKSLTPDNESFATVPLSARSFPTPRLQTTPSPGRLAPPAAEKSLSTHHSTRTSDSSAENGPSPLLLTSAASPGH